MLIRRDFVFDEIDSLSNLLCLTLFPKDFKISDIDNFAFFDDALNLKKDLQKLIDLKNLNEAENLLFSKIDDKSLNYEILQVGVWFYLNINKFDDEFLEKVNFSRHEICQGLKDITNYISPKFE